MMRCVAAILNRLLRRLVLSTFDIAAQRKKAVCVLDSERSRNQRQGPEILAAK